MSEMEKAYEPQKYEANIYKRWEESGAFSPTSDGEKPPFSIIMPPPNANGSLHTGHAMFTVEDIMIRYRRMQGHPTLWLPGTDHAGIETQVVFERELAKEGKSRFDFTPQEFYEAALAYTKNNQHNIISQLKSLGFSADWSRLKFTLDQDILDVVYDTFRQMLDDGYIYRGNRIVNWCPRCKSSFADIEVKYREQADPLYYIKYGPFVLATVRPETKFGDTAIAVHPDDERYQQYIDTDIEAEDLLGPIKLKVIADTFVNPDFGSGAVKVTPAHDPNDWEMGLRHKLEVKSVIDTDGLLNKAAGKYAGMTVLEARDEVVKELEARGLIDHIDMNYTHSVGYHDRCGTQIEPLVTEQWWLDVGKLKQPAIDAVKNGDITIVPSRFTKVYIDWLENLRDWNISRQNWFGIRIPVYYNTNPDNGKAPYKMFSRENLAEEYYGKNGYERETDTFDTWFSSSQWPYATLMATGDFDRFYPTSVMETGRDILFQWVTRMVMLGLYRTGKVPFTTVYLHGLVNDAHGKKMSKSKGNVINPLEKTAEFGTDALRLALTIGITPGNDGALGDQKIAGYRNFCNKLWNVARYTQMFSRENPDESSNSKPEPKTLADMWILTKFSRENTAITKAIEEYRFSEAGERVYSLLWNDLADWYVEASKEQPNYSVLRYCLEHILKLAHPFAPFVTEAIWQHLEPTDSGMLITSPWPVVGEKYTQEAQLFEELKNLIVAARSMSANLGLQKPKLLYLANQELAANSDIVARLGRLGGATEVARGRGLRLHSNRFDAWLDVDEQTVQRHIDALHQKYTDAESYLSRLEKQLANKQYVASAPAHLVQQTKDRIDETKLLLSQLDEQLSTFR